MNHIQEDWVVVAVDPVVEWVDREQTVIFRGRELILRPGTDDFWPDVSLLRLPSESYFVAATLVHRFLSAAAWKRKAAIRVEGHSGGSHRTRIGGRKQTAGFRIRMLPGYDFESLYESTSPKQDLALALYREAIGLNHNTYKLLGLFRILNITLGEPQKQISWINGNLVHIPFPAKERVLTLQKEVVPEYATVGDYLYAARRSALAHAFSPPLVDPDLMEHVYQVNLDLSFVELLVELYMTKELGLPEF